MNEVTIYKDWAEIAIGIQNNWLDYRQLTHWADTGTVLCLSAERYADVYWAEKGERETVLRLLRDFIKQDYGVEIPMNREDLEIDYRLEVFQKGLKIWEYKFLRTIYLSDKEISEKIDNDIHYLWMDFMYFNVDWDNFIWIYAYRLNISEEELYNNFEKHLQNLYTYLMER